MASLIVVDQNGREVEQEVESRNVAIVTESQRIEPAVVQRVEYDHEGGISQITYSSCSRTENRRESDKGPDLAVEGVVGEEGKDALKTLHHGQNITLVSDVETTSVVVKRVTIEQNTDIIHITPDGGEEQLAFPFQLQLKEPEGGGVGTGGDQGDISQQSNIELRTDFE